MQNFIPTANPFGLATPPAWFLKRLFAYDSQLVIFPSTSKAVYQMGRRGRNGHGLLRPLAGLPDTNVFAAHRVWPWKEILPSGINNGWAEILLEIPQYDTQRYKDPAGQLDSVEAQAEADVDANIADGASELAGQMYRTLGLINGSRVGSGRRAEGAGYRALGDKSRAPRRRVHRPTAPSGTGAIWTGR